MNSTTAVNIRRLAAKGFCRRDIIAITGAHPVDVRTVLHDRPHKYRSARQEMLANVPLWWEGTDEAYFECVRANFPELV